MNFSVSAKDPVIVRAKIKSKGSVQVHSFSRSSISKMQFGGTLELLALWFDNSWKTYMVGWIGLRSTPITLASGWASAALCQ